MKLYRLVPNYFSTDNRILSQDKDILEVLYYRIKYLYFAKEEQQKKFYICEEDSWKIGEYELKKNHQEWETSFLLEYDIPSHIIVEDINRIENPYPTIIVNMSKDKLKQYRIKQIPSSKIRSSEMQKEIYPLFQETIQEAVKTKNKDYDWYQKYCIENYESFTYLMNNPNTIIRVLKRNDFHLTREGILFFSNYPTGNIKLVTKNFPIKEEDAWLRENLLRYTTRQRINKVKILEKIMEQE